MMVARKALDKRQTRLERYAKHRKGIATAADRFTKAPGEWRDPAKLPRRGRGSPKEERERKKNPTPIERGVSTGAVTCTKAGQGRNKAGRVFAFSTRRYKGKPHSRGKIPRYT